MKKLLALALALAMVLTPAGCLKNDGTTEENKPPVTGNGDTQTPTGGGNDTGGKPDTGDKPAGDGKTDDEDKPVAGEDDPGDGDKTEDEDKPDDGGEETPPEGGSFKFALAPGAAALASVTAEGWEISSGGDPAPELKNGDIDAAAISLSQAARLYRETGGAVQAAAILTSGGWLVAERGDTVTDMLSLGGRTVYAPQDAGEAVAVLGYIAMQYGFDLGDTLIIEPVSDAASRDVALLPEGGMGEGQRAALSLAEEWEYATGSDLLPGMVLAVRSDLDSEALDTLLAALETAASAAPGTDTTKYVFITGSAELRKALEGHLELLYGVDPGVVGGSIPDDGFYR